MLVGETDRNGWNGLWHYYHFVAEDLLGGLALLGSVTADHARDAKDFLPERVLVPFASDYHDKWGMNDMVVQGLFDGRKFSPFHTSVSVLSCQG